MKRVLIVDDEPAVADVLEFALQKAGFSVDTAGTVAAARRALRNTAPDFVVLDLGLPDGDGVELCRWLRERSQVPVLMLTCRDEEIDRVLGLEQGADDYVVKPFSPREVVARIRSILRRTTPSQPQGELRHGAMTMRPHEHRVTVDQHVVDLTPREFDLLQTLLENPQRVFSRGSLVEQAYRGESVVSGRTVDSHIKGIRRKFAQARPGFDPIETVYGVGYRAKAEA
ncbi:MAG: response regulator transcription factor [Deltaproteobacteria bacterium]|nr:response regulator transcription factor [Deltaproteobacteria bacterium]